jgi:hypothetical protein
LLLAGGHHSSLSTKAAGSRSLVNETDPSWKAGKVVVVNR